jgi:hypothetical protein
MALQPPKKNAVGFFLAITPPISSPRLQWDTSGNWTVTPEWSAWASKQRTSLLETLLNSPKWFSKPPRREVLDPLFHPWDGKSMQGVPLFLCPPPEAPEAGIAGSALWQLQGLMMSSRAITPVWVLEQVVREERVEAISLFDDGLTVDSDESESREIQLEEVDDSPEPAPPTRIRSREWEAKKFMAKERVREARLKAQIAVRMAETEETRFFRIFGDLDDAESNFSDYDLSPSSSEGEAE